MRGDAAADVVIVDEPNGFPAACAFDEAGAPFAATRADGGGAVVTVGAATAFATGSVIPWGLLVDGGDVFISAGTIEGSVQPLFPVGAPALEDVSFVVRISREDVGL